MRIRFEFSMTKLPIAYRLGTLSIIKEMIHAGSKDYYQHIFLENSKEMKPFAHSSYIQNLIYNGQEINGDQLHVTVSSHDYEFMMHLMNGSQRSSVYSYKGYDLILQQKRLLPKPPEFTDMVTFKTASPLLIENKFGEPLLANDTAFEEEFNYYANLVATELHDRKLLKPIKITQSSMKKVVIKENLHHEKNKDIFITANHGILQLNGEPEDLKLIYESGIGRRRSLGLGLLNIEEVTY